MALFQFIIILFTHHLIFLFSGCFKFVTAARPLLTQVNYTIHKAVRTTTEIKLIRNWNKTAATTLKCLEMFQESFRFIDISIRIGMRIDSRGYANEPETVLKHFLNTSVLFRLFQCPHYLNKTETKVCPFHPTAGEKIV